MAAQVLSGGSSSSPWQGSKSHEGGHYSQTAEKVRARLGPRFLGARDRERCYEPPMRKVRLGPLDAVMTAAPSPASDGTRGGTERPLWIVLLHGFGAPATDLAGLSAALAPLPPTRFVYPGGLHPLGFPYGGDGRCWWPIDFGELDGARARGDHEAIARAEPAGLTEARNALGEALAVLERDHGLERERLILGGFSQGAMLACDFALRSETPLAGLVLLSGMPIAWSTWSERLPRRRGLPVFQSHSPDDQVLPFALAERLAHDLTGAGLDVTFVPFRGGHGIPHPVLQGLRTFLEARAAGPSGQ